VVSYQYDANSNRTQLSLNGATNATYQYDVINRLTQITDNAALNVTFAYDATNKLTSRTLPNGVVSTYQYDGLDRLTRLTHAKSPNTLLDLQYQFNTVNNITQMIDGAGTHNYSYDTLDRLTAATHPNQPNEGYTLDDVGNRTASHQGSSYSYQAFNRLVSANGTMFGYDANGNQTTKSDTNGSWTYVWDYENRLKQSSLSGGVTVTYFYDALGRRVQRTSSTSGTERFVYDGADVVRDLDGTNATVADYLNGPSIDNKLRQTSSGTPSYLVADHLGTTRSLIDPSGNVSSTFSYDSFGNVVGGSASTRYTYAGREADFENGMTYYRARWYASLQGRFVSEDPLGLAGGDFNLYRYVLSNPVRYFDPEGTQARSDRNWNEGERNPATGRRLSNDLNQAAGMWCALDGFNPWLNVDVGGGFQFLNFMGGGASLGVMVNPFTLEICIYTKFTYSPALAIGLYGGAGLQLGAALGPAEGRNASGPGGELFFDAASGVGLSGRLAGISNSSFFGGAAVGPTIGKGFSLGLKASYTKILYCINSPKCPCKTNP
jgi:RHS repeat-associated protein